MWIDFKPNCKTLESQKVVVKGLCPKTPLTGAAYSTSYTSQLNLKHFTWVRLDRLVSSNPQIIFLYYPWVETHWRFSQKKRCTIHVWLATYTSEKIRIFKMKLKLGKSLQIILQYNIMCTIHLPLLFIGKAH